MRVTVVQQDVISRTYKIGCEEIEMIDNKTQLRTLYEDAVYLHLVHNGHKVRRVSVRIFWNEDGLE